MYIKPNDDLVICIEKRWYADYCRSCNDLFSTKSRKKGILLTDTDLVCQIFEDDKEVSLDERIFPQAEYEYYDVQQDILIKLYKAKKYNEVYGG